MKPVVLGDDKDPVSGIVGDVCAEVIFTDVLAGDLTLYCGHICAGGKRWELIHVVCTNVVGSKRPVSLVKNLRSFQVVLVICPKQIVITIL